MHMISTHIQIKSTESDFNFYISGKQNLCQFYVNGTTASWKKEKFNTSGCVASLPQWLLVQNLSQR